MKVIRCLKSVRLVGVSRRAGDTVTAEEWMKVSSSVQNALIGSKTVEVFNDEKGVWEKLAELESRLDTLEGKKKVNNDGVMQAVVSSDEPHGALQSDEVVSKLKRGVRVVFVAEGVRYVGVAKRIIKSTKVVEVTVDKDVWEVGFADVVEVESQLTEVKNVG